MAREDTIAAIATPAGVGGIGVLRVSGDGAEDIGRNIFRPRKDILSFESHRLYHGDIVNPDTQTVIDEVMVVLMRGPHSYTGEDVLEISCHGNPLILGTVLESVLKLGVRIAEPGEFTKRAFLNNRIDLAQAEAVAELITTRTDRGLKHALYTMKGVLSEAVASIRSSLLDVLVLLETSIDFTEEDIELPSPGNCVEHLEKTAWSLEKLLATYARGKLYSRGMTVVIAGRPNVGKSSLLNCLAGKPKAIVTSEPGTTRDLIEVDIMIGDLPVRCVDTAGIRESDHDVERQGVSLARRRAAEADIVIVVIDGSADLLDDDRRIIEETIGGGLLIAVNKSDLPQRHTREEMEALVPGHDFIFISAKENRGIDALKERILTMPETAADIDGTDVVLTNLRHKEALEKVLSLVHQSKQGLQENRSPELIAFDVRESLRTLSLITGEGAGDEVLDIIFSRFCIGK
ncbi:MAG: tRNA uridine-5-carboxymethylaminomethyl(34) synthesis GTPase MnmE [Syntrophales bacterium]|jgi:tRNA modification GTPase|nr:tRNA uridine-5-carboxymethylaminomethyl(34) synthesis GTPase MnmE [Syntrophales bacterium]MCK9528375.1 tRNA uridine-5-carboxymethylaminomethyl(34) synthesis GTPase MnmE [Syntrophales bacterium]MDX9922700.1 tRNA uridine-5-carboxymethylaminomethyl(34) synthesis GTPase MnmE [Syntrophales bacterium]